MTRPKPKVFDPNYDKVKKSRKHENRIASSLGGRTLIQSGAAAPSKWARHLDGSGHESAKGDIRTDDFHIEHKSTEKKSMSLKLEWLNKVREGARRAALYPAIVVTFEKGLRDPEDWVLLPKSVLDRLLANQESIDE